MYLSILFLPLYGSIISGLLGRKLGVKGSQYLTSSYILITTLLCVGSFYEVVLGGSPVSLYLSDWVNVGIFKVDWELNFDSLTVSMLVPVCVVSTLVHMYSISYMSSDPHNQRFFSYLSLFTFSMIVLVTGSNYLMLFLGWELIGVSSYLLINFWFTRVQANKSALKAMFINRVGDMYFSIFLLLAYWSHGSFDYKVLEGVPFSVNQDMLTIMIILLLVSSIGKSAQLGLHTWLPDAIEGPTPVSALIHAATLVTAGVYLLLRSSSLLEYAPTSLVIVLWVGSVTSFFAATTGLLQNDLKRVIAYSTCSQMGYLLMSVGLSEYSLSLFHLVNHAYFKGVLFLAAGGVLHSMKDQQDMRRLGGLMNILPFTYSIIMIGSLSLIALPFLSGYYSKDLIIEEGYAQYSISGSIVYWLGTLTATITAFYSFRLISMTFITTPKSTKQSYMDTHEQDITTIFTLVILGLLSIFFGYLCKDIFVGMGTDGFNGSLLSMKTSLVEAEFMPVHIKLLPGIATILGAGMALLLYHRYGDFSTELASEILFYGYKFFNGKWYFDTLINNYIVKVLLKLGSLTANTIDRGFVELIGPNGVTKIIHKDLFTKTGSHYVIYIIVGLISFALLLFMPQIYEIYLDIRFAILFLILLGIK